MNITNKHFILFLLFHFTNGKIKKHKIRKPPTNTFDPSNVTECWMKQPVDHFNETDTRTWDMMYLENMEKYNRGPVYIYIAGEDTPLNDTSYLETGLIYELAEETTGAMFAIEHRYYGESKPFENVTKENIKYLHSRQALADIARFIDEKIKKDDNFKTSKVVVIGGSYAGNLAAWMRLKYKDKVDAAIASSAPVLAKLDFNEYLAAVGDDFKKYAPVKCFKKITQQFANYSRDLRNKTKMKKLKKRQHICKRSNLSEKKNKAEFFLNMFYNMTDVAQDGTKYMIKEYCRNMKEEKYCKDTKCCEIDFNQDYPATNDGIEEDNFWVYQTCNEFGYFLTKPANAPFNKITMDVDYSVEICTRTFGEQFTKEYIEEKITETNKEYGGLDPSVTNVLFTHGEIDPWNRLGILKNLSDKAPAFLIPGASHCNDLMPDMEVTSTDDVKKIKKESKRIIKQWIGWKE